MSARGEFSVIIAGLVAVSGILPPTFKHSLRPTFSLPRSLPFLHAKEPIGWWWSSDPDAYAHRRAPNIALAATTATVFVLSVAMAPTTSAHADLQVSTPADGESLDIAPEEIRLTFSEELFEELVEISILDAAGDLYSTIEVEQTPPPGTDVIFPWPTQAPPGEYSIAYRVVSADGHPVTGTISFSYAATAPEPSTPEHARHRPTARPLRSHQLLRHHLLRRHPSRQHLPHPLLPNLNIVKHRFIVWHAPRGTRCRASRRYRYLGDHCRARQRN